MEKLFSKMKWKLNEVERGTILLFILMGIFNLFNFIFHFLMARKLGPGDYGTLAVLMSFIYIYGIPGEAIQNIITKYTAKFNSENKTGKVKFLLKKSVGKSFWLSILTFIILAILSIFFSIFLKINYLLLLITNIFIFFSFIGPIPKGILQGQKKFVKLGSVYIVESVLKLVAAFGLVYLGFQVFGAISGVMVGLLIGFVYSFYANRQIISSKEEKTVLEKIYSKSIPYFISVIIIFLMMNLDIILAKRFFAEDLVGKYSAISILGKIIFFGTFAISKTMFPFVSENHESKKDTTKIFNKSIGIVFTISLSVILIYTLFSDLIVNFLYGSEFLGISHYLIYSAISMSLLSLSNLILIYGLSVDRTKHYWVLFVFFFIEVILLFTFNNNIQEYVLALMVSMIIMFIGSLILVKKWKK